MAAFIPSRRDPEVNAVAMAKVREDKEREAGDGFDGTWVAHPDLVPVATEIFDRVLGDRPNQKDRQREDVPIDAERAARPGDPGSAITEAGLRNNVSVGLQYVAAWLQGLGAVAIYNLMEDAATAEISRAQLWQWLRHGKVERADVERVIEDEVAKLGDGYDEARRLFEQVALPNENDGDEFVEFLTLPAYERIDWACPLGAHGDPNQVVSASRKPASVPSPTQATYPSGRIRTAAGASTGPSAGSSHVPTYSASTS